MTVTSNGYYYQSASWKSGGAAKKAKVGASDAAHAERAAYSAIGSTTATVFKFDQDDFPCEKCVSYFVKESLAGKSFVFKCTGNAGGYAVDSGFCDNTPAVKFNKTLAGVLLFSNGSIYSAGRVITVTPTTTSTGTKYVATGTAVIAGPPVVPAVFTALSGYPNF